MILCPLQNTEVYGLSIQKRPVITQHFGENPDMYKQFNIEAHNGYDYRASVGTPIFASIDGVVKVSNQGTKGYGLYIKQRGAGREVVYAHLSQAHVQSGQHVHMGDFLGYSGNTGYSTAPHLHLGMRRYKDVYNDVWACPVLDYDNGYNGWLPIMSPDGIIQVITWKGTLNTFTL